MPAPSPSWTGDESQLPHWPTAIFSVSAAFALHGRNGEQRHCTVSPTAVPIMDASPFEETCMLLINPARAISIGFRTSGVMRSAVMRLRCLRST